MPLKTYITYAQLASKIGFHGKRAPKPHASGWRVARSQSAGAATRGWSPKRTSRRRSMASRSSCVVRN